VQGPSLTAPDLSWTGTPQRARSDDSLDFERLDLHVEDPRLAAISGRSHNPRRKPGADTKVAWSIAIAVAAMAAVTLMKFQAERARDEKIRQAAIRHYSRLGEPNFMTWLVNKHHRDCYRASTSLGNRRGTFDPGTYYGLMDARIKSDMSTLGNDFGNLTNRLFQNSQAPMGVGTVPPAAGPGGMRGHEGPSPSSRSWGGTIRQDEMRPGAPVVEVDLSGTAVDDVGLAHLERLSDLENLFLSGTQVTDVGLAHLRGLTGLRQLVLDHTRVSDAGLAHLERLTGLQWLVLDQTQVSDAGLAHLERLTGLQMLNLAGTRVSDAGLAHLRGLTGLQGLSLASTRVSDVGLVHLEGLTALPALNLSHTAISDAGLAHLERMTGLQILNLTDTRLSDAGLVHLSGLAGLEKLFLASTAVSDAGLAHLKGLTGLRKLVLDHTRVTDAGVKDLQQALPDVTVLH
jgi:Leucine Rich repeat